MKEGRINLIGTFGLGTITKVTKEMGPILKQSSSKSVVAIYLGQLYRSFSDKEQLCMLNILHTIYNGAYRTVIDLMNIKTDDKLNYIEKAKNIKARA